MAAELRRSGELDNIPVLDVGMGVGYRRLASMPMFWRLIGRGSPGEEDRGSKGGSKEGAGRFVPASEEAEPEGIGSWGSFADEPIGLGEPNGMIRDEWVKSVLNYHARVISSVVVD